MTRDDPRRQGAYEELIPRLVADLSPTPRLPHPVRRAALWLSVVALLALGFAFFSDLAAAAHYLTVAPDMWLAVVGSAATAILATIAAFELSLPDRKWTWALAPVPALLLWIAASGAGCLRTWLVPGAHEAPLDEAKDCLLFIVALSIPLSALLIVMLRRARPLRPYLTSAIGGLAVAASTATLLVLFHPFDATATDLLAHVVAVAIVVALNVFFSRRVFDDDFARPSASANAGAQ